MDVRHHGILREFEINKIHRDLDHWEIVVGFPAQDRVEVFAGKLIDRSHGSKPFNRRGLRLQINDKVHRSPSLSQPQAINRRWPFLASLTVIHSRPPNVKASHNSQRRSELLLRPRPNLLPVTPNPYKPTTSPPSSMPTQPREAGTGLQRTFSHGLTASSPPEPTPRHF